MLMMMMEVSGNCLKFLASQPPLSRADDRNDKIRGASVVRDEHASPHEGRHCLWHGQRHDDRRIRNSTETNRLLPQYEGCAQPDKELADQSREQQKQRRDTQRIVEIRVGEQVLVIEEADVPRVAVTRADQCFVRQAQSNGVQRRYDEHQQQE